MKKETKNLIGLGAVGAIAYLAYNQLSPSDESLGGSGTFAGLGSGESVSDQGILGTSDSGINYSFNFPEVPSFSPDGGGIIGGGDNPIITDTGDTSLPVSKKEAVSSGNASKAETSGSLSASLGQVFGTPEQKTNERGDYYTSPAGGGAGAIKGQSIGETVLNLLSGKTASGKSGSGNSLPTGASTEVSSYKLPSNLDSLKGMPAPVNTSGVMKAGYNSGDMDFLPSNYNSGVKKVSTPATSTKKVLSLNDAKNGSVAKSSPTVKKKVTKVK
ncbi:hypothetical protein [Bacteroides sp.]|uniref:hypothetical protein n=1 Tax=Bacteroides sp. TaxID=29523 RepID=UPI002608B963|nr:hypothetical protein [Bacteroides sp.]MDD3041166.1 hypothetical protein [Bacteroides sp.]